MSLAILAIMLPTRGPLLPTDASGRALPAACEPSLTDAVLAMERTVRSLAAHTSDPPGPTGSTGNVPWMLSQLGMIRDACSRGGDVEAAWRLEQVQLRMANTVSTVPAHPRKRSRHDE